LINYVAKC